MSARPLIFRAHMHAPHSPLIRYTMIYDAKEAHKEAKLTICCVVRVGFISLSLSISLSLFLCDLVLHTFLAPFATFCFILLVTRKRAQHDHKSQKKFEFIKYNVRQRKREKASGRGKAKGVRQACPVNACLMTASCRVCVATTTATTSAEVRLGKK